MARTRRRLLVLVTLLVSIAVDAGWAAPLRVTREIRAASCCSQNCGHLRSMACDSGCCPTAKTAYGTAISPAARDQAAAPGVTVEAIGFAAAVPPRLAGETIAFAPSANESPPIFLLIRAFRL